MKKVVRKSTATLVAEELELAIATGELAPGSKLPSEAKLSAKFGCGVDCLREAVGRLIGKGLLVSVHGVGRFVISKETTLSIDRLPPLYRTSEDPKTRAGFVRHYFELRRMILSEVLCGACRRATPAQLDALEGDLMNAVDAAQNRGDVRAALEWEVYAIQRIADACDFFGARLVANTLRDFFHDAQHDLTKGVTAEEIAERAFALSELVSTRDVAAIRAFIETTLCEADRRTLSHIENSAPGARPPAESLTQAEGSAADASDRQDPVRIPRLSPVGEPAAMDSIQPEPGPARSGGGGDARPPRSPPGALGTAKVTAAGMVSAAVGAGVEVSSNVSGRPLPEAEAGAEPPEIAADASTRTPDDVASSTAMSTAGCACPPPIAGSSGEPMPEWVEVDLSDDDELAAPCPAPSGERPSPALLLPRSDPSSWYPTFIAFYERTYRAKPWDDELAEPPGVDLQYLREFYPRIPPNPPHLPKAPADE